jgi:hypothetical protein
MTVFSHLATLAILPEGTVRDEGSFFLLISLLAGLIGVAIFLRLRRK